MRVDMQGQSQGHGQAEHGTLDQAPVAPRPGEDGYRIFVEAWDPSYGVPLDAAETGPTGESSAQLGLDVELAVGAWGPLSPPPSTRAPSVVLLVDGVLRTDAWLWVEEADGSLHPGLAASYAAGVVRCDLVRGSAVIAPTRIERGLFTPSPRARDLVVANTRYAVHHVAATEPTQLRAAVGPQMQALEATVAALARGAHEAAQKEATQEDEDLLVVDGPLGRFNHQARALGYVKTHRVQYLPADLAALVGRLRPGQRCPVFLLGTNWHRYTWYLKLPGPIGSPWSGVVRIEASADLPRGEVIRLADLSAVTLPRFASTAYKDARAPQNLTPIAGLERRLRGMLGDQRLLLRSLASAAANQRGAAAGDAAAA
jgi:hypothetical protein